MLETFLTWLHKYESVAIWLEGIALVAIFIWDRVDASQQHQQTLAQMEIMRNHARATETAASAADKSAEAAAKSAEAVVNAERSWIMTTLDSADHAHIHDTENSQTGEFTSVVHLTLNYTNVGRVPCWITDKAVWFCMLESIPTDPVFDTPTRHFSETEPMVQAQTNFMHLSQLTCKGVHVMVLSGDGKGGNVPIFYGYVRYRDPFGTNRETRFGYMVKGHRWERIPLESYNRNS